MVFKRFNFTSLYTLLKSAFSGIPPKIWLLSFVSLINRSGAMVICFLALYLTENLNFTIEQAGYAMSSYGLGAIVGAFLGGKLTDRIGYRNVMLLTLSGTGIIMLLTMLVTKFFSMCTILFLLNCVSEAFRPASSVSIKVNSTEEIRARSFSLYRVFINLAISLALTLGGIIIGFGWKWIFICDAITCFFAAVLLFVTLPQSTYEPENGTQGYPDVKRSVACQDTDFILFLLFTFLSAVAFMQILWTVPAFFKHVYGWSESRIGMVSALNGLVVMLIELPLIFVLEGKKKTLWMVRLGIILYGLSYIMLTLPAEFGILWAIAYMVIISFGEMLVMPFSSTWVTFRSPLQNQGEYLALYTMSYSFSNVLSPWIGTQIIAQLGYSYLWMAMVVVSTCSLLGFYWLERRLVKSGQIHSVPLDAG